jgi:hypothetical protein
MCAFRNEMSWLWKLASIGFVLLVFGIIGNLFVDKYYSSDLVYEPLFLIPAFTVSLVYLAGMAMLLISGITLGIAILVGLLTLNDRLNPPQNTDIEE